MSDNFADKMKSAVSRETFSLKKLTAFFLFGAIALVFVLYGYSTHSGDMTGNVAQVNHTLFTITDLKREEQRVQQMYARMFGNAMDFSSQRYLLTQQAVESLVNSELVSQAAQKEGLKATDKEVVNFIVQDYTLFQVNGVFQRDLYFRFLEGNGFTPADFESLIRKDIENQRSRQAFEWASSVNKLEQEKDQILKQTQVVLSTLTLNPRELESRLKSSDADVQKALADSAFLKRAEDEFKARKSQFSQEEQVKAQHVLIKFTAGDAKSESEALEKIKALKVKSMSSDFGALAEKNSEDPGSKAKKGDLGFFTRGRMLPEFENVAFALKVGEISEPVKTQFGYHLIKVTDRKAAREAQFDMHKSDVAQILLARDKVNLQKLRAQEVFEKGEETSWMKEMNLTWKDVTFDLSSDRVPEVPEKVLGSLSELKNVGQVKVLSEGDVIHVVKLKGIQKAEKAEKASALAGTLARMRANEAFVSWVEKFKTASKVEVNPQILKP